MFIEKDWQSIYMQLGILASEIPSNFENKNSPVTPEIQRWIGRAYPLISQINNQLDPVQFSTASDHLEGILREANANKILSILFRNLAIAESNCPASTTGSFIPVGHEFDTLVTVGKIFSHSKETLLIVDPYMDEKILTIFVPSAPEGITVNLLFSNIDNNKIRLQAAIKAWKNQYKTIRPLEARIAPKKSLHDRMIIIDKKNVWSLTQSFASFANRSPATIIKVEGDAAEMKSTAFLEIWEASQPIDN